MFKFGFGDPAQPQQEVGGGHAEDGHASPPAVADAKAEEVPASDAKPTGMQDTVVISKELSLIKGVINNSQAAALLADERVQSNDLVPGVYEGGFKSWEGGVDLARFLAASPRAAGRQDAGQDAAQQQQGAAGAAAAVQLGRGSRVIELGCGHGLPGLVALRAGAEVHFQDYNRSVLSTLTMPNVAANAAAWAVQQQQQQLGAPAPSPRAAGGAALDASAAAAAGARARYFAGSWDALPVLLADLELQHSYEMVLSAETIYSSEAMRSLYDCITACLRPGSGVALVAAKSYYFGVGGGTAAFKELVESEGLYSCEAVAVIDDGVSTRREILRLAPKQGQA